MNNFRNWSDKSIPGVNGIGVQTCLISLIERILHELLPRLQILLLQRCHTNWLVVLGAMSALSMTADQWGLISLDPQLAGRLNNFENGWNVLTGLYKAAYGSYHVVRVSSANNPRAAQTDKTALWLLDELKLWVEDVGMYILIWCSLPPQSSLG